MKSAPCPPQIHVQFSYLSTISSAAQVGLHDKNMYVRKHLAFVRSQSTSVVLWLKMNASHDMTKFMSKKAEPEHFASNALTSTSLASYEAPNGGA